ncbi:MAG: hypothetical protein KGD74_00890 [Candidatus Lokiarchaeota archaeon]|nr:hypothetical protein [Candidatus Lokiarchaeota archaeon]
MLFQNEYIVRLIIVSIFQIWPVFYGSYFAYRLLKRAKNRSTYILSAYFITMALTYFLATLSTYLANTPFSYIIYVISIYFFVFSYSFLINFSWLLTKLDEKSSNITFYLRISFYGILSLFVIIIGIPFTGITLNATTGWVPNYSWFFLGFSWTYFLLFLIIPQIYLSLKILKVYEGIVLKRRLNRFIIAVFIGLLVLFFLFLYNTWIENGIFRTFYIFIIPELATLAAYLVYKGFGKDLD